MPELHLSIPWRRGALAAALALTGAIAPSCSDDATSGGTVVPCLDGLACADVSPCLGDGCPADAIADGAQDTPLPEDGAPSDAVPSSDATPPPDAVADTPGATDADGAGNGADAGAEDSGPSDGGAADPGTGSDAPTGDAGGTTDGGTPDTGTPDTGTPDTGTPDTGPDGGVIGDTSDQDASPCVDEDGDGFSVGAGCVDSLDCDDTDPDIYPGAPEICANGVDDDCDPGTPDIGDADGDGAGCDVDCHDDDPARFPDQVEACGDGVDNNCDDIIDCAEAACAADPACLACDLDGTYEPPGELCDDGNDCDHDGCAASSCRREAAVILTRVQVGDASVGFDLDDADGDGDPYTGIDNALGGNGLLRSQLNPAMDAAVQQGLMRQIFVFTGLDNVPYGGAGTPGYESDPDVTMSLVPAVDPACPAPAYDAGNPPPWVASPPGEMYADSDAFAGCVPPVLVTDEDDPANGIYPTNTHAGQPPAPYIHLGSPLLVIPAGSFGVLNLVKSTVEATVTNDGVNLTGLTDGVMGGVIPADVLYAIDTTGQFGANCPTALHAVAGFVGSMDQDVDGGGLESLVVTAGFIPCVVSPVTLGCKDEDGTDIPDSGPDGSCVLDPRMADGYSVGMTVEAREVHVVQQVSESTYCP